MSLVTSFNRRVTPVYGDHVAPVRTNLNLERVRTNVMDRLERISLGRGLTPQPGEGTSVRDDGLSTHEQSATDVVAALAASVLGGSAAGNTNVTPVAGIGTTAGVGALGVIGQGVDPQTADAAWLMALAQFDTAQTTAVALEDLHPLLRMAEQLGIPREQAIVDAVNALGLVEAGEALAAQGDPMLNDIVSLLFERGGELDLELVSFLLKLGEELAKPVEERGGNTARTGRAQSPDRILALLQALQSQLQTSMQQMIERLDRIERNTGALAGAVSGQMGSMQAELAAMAHNSRLSELRMETRMLAGNDEGEGQHYFTQDEVGYLADQMREIGREGSPANQVARDEWMAAAAGIRSTPGLTNDERVVMLDQLATHLLSEEEAGNLTIAHDARGMIEAAAEGAPGDTELPDDAAPVVAPEGEASATT